MDYGRVEYFVDNKGGVAVKLRLTLVGQGDDEVLRVEGLSALRRLRVHRLATEAERQGHLLGYEDLSGLLFSSVATIKRDVRVLEDETGQTVPLKGRRKAAVKGNGVKGHGPAMDMDRLN